MNRRLGPGPIVIASHNAGKVREFAELLQPWPLQIVSAAQAGLPEPEETGDSFVANAELKARAAADGAQLPALADDSGLAVAALGGLPGIYSARWAGKDRDFSKAMKRVHRELGTAGDRRARFVCALALAWPDGYLATFEGQVTGTITWPPRGNRGFGYDPIFVAERDSVTFGQLDPAEKHARSHRANAFQALVSACLDPA